MRLDDGAATTRATALAAAAVALGHAVELRSGHLGDDAIAWLTVALALAALGVVAPAPRRDRARRLFSGAAAPAVTAVLALGAGWQLAVLARGWPAVSVGGGEAALRWFHAGVAVAAGVVALAVAGPARGRALRLAPLLAVALLATHFALGVWLIQHVPDPRIDVDVIHRGSLEALLRGENPYALTFPNIYGSTTMYGPAQLVAGRTDCIAFGYCYPPVSLLLALPGHLVGDYRYGYLAAMTATGALLVVIGGSRRGLLAAAVLLFTPRVFYVLEHGWTDPVVALLLVAVVASALRAPRLLPLALGLFLASKQYSVIAVPLLPLLLAGRARRAALRTVALALAVAAAITLPFLAGDPAHYVWGVLVLQFHSPFRPDALSYPALFARHGGRQLSSLWGFVAAIPALGAARRHAAGGPAGFAAGAGLAYLAFFAWNKQAFANYYYFCIAALAAAAAATAAPSEGASASSPLSAGDSPPAPATYRPG